MRTRATRRLGTLRRHLVGATEGGGSEEASSPAGHALLGGEWGAAALDDPEFAAWNAATRTSQRPTVPARRQGPSSALDGQGAPYSAAQHEQIIEQLKADGYYHLGPVLSAAETRALLEVAERKLADPYKDYEKLPRMFEYDPAARDLIVREPFPSLAEAILGPECHMMSQNWLSTTQEEGLKRVEQIEGGGGCECIKRSDRCRP